MHEMAKDNVSLMKYARLTIYRITNSPVRRISLTEKLTLRKYGHPPTDENQVKRTFNR